MPEILVSLTALADILKLPREWLREEAGAGRIPCLRIGCRLRFNPRAVEAKLAARAGREVAYA